MDGIDMDYVRNDYTECGLRDLLMVCKGKLEAYDGMQDELDELEEIYAKYQDNRTADVMIPVKVIRAFVDGGRDTVAGLFDKCKSRMIE